MQRFPANTVVDDLPMSFLISYILKHLPMKKVSLQSRGYSSENKVIGTLSAWQGRHLRESLFFLLSCKHIHPSLQQVNLQRLKGSVQMPTKTNPRFWFKVSSNLVGDSCLEWFTVFHIFILFRNTQHLLSYKTKARISG